MQRGLSEPVPPWTVFLETYGTLLPDLPPFQLAPLTAKSPRQVLAKMSSRSAAGLDCWEVTSLKALPDELFDGLRILYDSVQFSGKWPEALAYGYLCCIPKPDSDGSPASLRHRVNKAHLWQHLQSHSRFRAGD